jgi:hypothetical protein
MYSRAVPSEVICWFVGMKIAFLVSRSTTTMIMSWLCDNGKGSTKSTVIISHAFCGISFGCSGAASF